MGVRPTDFSRFNIGSQVSFETDEGRVFGILIKFNKKTVGAVTEDNERWNIAPQLLSLVKDAEVVQENISTTPVNETAQ